jgi:uncharacterized protein (DUF58 family)
MQALRVEREFVDRAFTGETLPVRLEIENTGRLPVAWVEMEEIVPLPLGERPLPVHVFAMGPKERRPFEYTIRCGHRGYYELGPLRARSLPRSNVRNVTTSSFRS